MHSLVWIALLVAGEPAEEHARLAQSAATRGRFDVAVVEWQKAIAADPANEGYYTDLGNLLLRTQNFNEAIVVLEHARGKFPRSAQTLVSLGVAYYGQRRFDGAVDALLAAIAVAPEVEQPYVFLSRILEHAGARMPEVVAASAAWAAKDPRNATAQLAWGKALAASGDAGKAAPVLERAVALAPANGEALYELGAVRESRRDFAGAAKVFERAAAAQPKSSLPHYRLSRVYARLGLADRAARERALHEKLAAAEKAEIDARQAAARKLELTVK